MSIRCLIMKAFSKACPSWSHHCYAPSLKTFSPVEMNFPIGVLDAGFTTSNPPKISALPKPPETGDTEKPAVTPP